jgi:hypothetical protein
MRRDGPQRITPELLELYRRKAKRLRDEAYRSMGYALWAWLTKIIRRR